MIDGADRSKGITVEFENSIVRSASVIAVDQRNDLAVLRTDMHGVQPVVPLARGDSTSVRVGDPTLTIGNPFGVDRTLTSGIVSALQHTIEAADGSRINNVIQVDQAPDAGNSGAPLIDAYGRVIGINSQMITGGSEFAQRVAFAIPIDTADTILSEGQPQRDAEGRLPGDRHAHQEQVPVERAEALVGDRHQAESRRSTPGLQEGDTIVKVDTVPIHSIADVLAIVSTRSPGQQLQMELRRDHRLHTVTVTLGSRTVSPASGEVASPSFVRCGVWMSTPPRSSSAASPTPTTPTLRSRPAPGRSG